MEETTVVERALLAEDLMAHIPLPRRGARMQMAGGCLSFQPGPVPYFANISAVRGDDGGLEALSETASEWFAVQGRSDFAWFLGPSTTPRATLDWLLRQGTPQVDRGTAMWLDSEPPGTSEVEVRTVDSPEMLLACREIAALGGGIDQLTEGVRAELASSNLEAWADLIAMAGRRRNYLAFMDGEPVAAAGLLFTDHDAAVLAGGATVAKARGMGCYHALVQARWRDAVEAGARNLVVQASDMSMPILASVGFRPVAEIVIVHQRLD
jgi:hypothetical protein